jgi:hypothetical protein
MASDVDGGAMSCSFLIQEPLGEIERAGTVVVGLDNCLRSSRFVERLQGFGGSDVRASGPPLFCYGVFLASCFFAASGANNIRASTRKNTRSAANSASHDQVNPTMMLSSAKSPKPAIQITTV